MEVCADEHGCLQRPEEDISSSRDAVTDVTAPWMLRMELKSL